MEKEKQPQNDKGEKARKEQNLKHFLLIKDKMFFFFPSFMTSASAGSLWLLTQPKPVSTHDSGPSQVFDTPASSKQKYIF